MWKLYRIYFKTCLVLNSSNFNDLTRVLQNKCYCGNTCNLITCRHSPSSSFLVDFEHQWDCSCCEQVNTELRIQPLTSQGLKICWGHSASCISCRRSTSKPCHTFLPLHCPFPKLFMLLSSKHEQDCSLLETRLEGEWPYSATLTSSLIRSLLAAKCRVNYTGQF